MLTRILTLIILATTLSGCYMLHPYQPDIQQGNVLTPRMVELVRPGMSKDTVENILGTPVLINPYDDNHWAYVYTYQHRGQTIHKKQLDLYFSNGRLVRMMQGAGIEADHE
ncbi:MAG: outer membrane protein assembly factor BamE [Gammaproteobacteria bacterium]